jgi:hypothetical protein
VLQWLAPRQWTEAAINAYLWKWDDREVDKSEGYVV